MWGLFHDAAGLFEKSRVQTAGIPIGEINSRALDPTTARAKITIRMHPGITLYENAVVSKKSASLLGEFYLEIDPGTPIAEVNGQRRQMRVLQERRPDQERPRAGGHGRDHGQRRLAAADPARHPRGRPAPDVRHHHRHRREREQADRDELGRARAFAEPGGHDRRQRRGRHDAGGRRRQGVDQERPRHHRVHQVADRHDAGAGGRHGKQGSGVDRPAAGDAG